MDQVKNNLLVTLALSAVLMLSTPLNASTISLVPTTGSPYVGVTAGQSLTFDVIMDLGRSDVFGGGFNTFWQPELVFDSFSQVAAYAGFGSPTPILPGLLALWNITDSGNSDPFGVIAPLPSGPISIGTITLLASPTLGSGTTEVTLETDFFGIFRTLTGDAIDISYVGATITGVVPIPAAVWLFGSALLGLVGMRRRSQHRPSAAS